MSHHVICRESAADLDGIDLGLQFLHKHKDQFGLDGDPRAVLQVRDP